MKVHTRLLSKLSPEQRRKFYNLNFRGDGMMRNIVSKREVKYLHEDSRVFWLEDRDKNVLSWAITFHYGSGKLPPDLMFTTYIYTRKNYRGRGLGTKLMKEVNTRFGKVVVDPHDTTSSNFFDKFKLVAR